MGRAEIGEEVMSDKLQEIRERQERIIELEDHTCVDDADEFIACSACDELEALQLAERNESSRTIDYLLSRLLLAEKLAAALKTHRVRYSRNHGMPNPTPAFPTHVEFSLADWKIVESALSAWEGK
jgi:hypothetical protein